MKPSRDAWSFYWAQGNATSLPELFPQNYHGSLLEFWEQTFANLRPGDRILDICTGNGAIALLAYEYALRKQLPCRIDGVDRADIRPATPAATADSPVTLNFSPRIQAEHLPFPTGAIDLVVGQFALEYCNAAAVIPELLRVLKDSGRLAFMIHHSESLTVKSAAEFVVIGETLLKAPSIFLRLRKCLALPLRKPAGREQALKQLQSSLRKLEDLTKRYPDNRALGALGQRLNDLAGRVHEPGVAATGELADLQERLEFHVRRARDLLQAAHDAERMTRLAGLMTDLGMKAPAFQPVCFEGTLLAWGLRVDT